MEITLCVNMTEIWTNLRYSGLEARSVVAREPSVWLAVTNTLLCGRPATWHTVIILGTGLPTVCELVQIDIPATKSIGVQRTHVVIWRYTYLNLKEINQLWISPKKPILDYVLLTFCMLTALEQQFRTGYRQRISCQYCYFMSFGISVKYIQPVGTIDTFLTLFELTIHGSAVLLLDLGYFFSFLILYTVGRTPWTGDQPVARPLPTHRTT
jgi:hypothetical protein